MSRSLITILFLIVGIQLSHCQDGNQIDIGSKYTIYSTVLDENREYWVNLPESYFDEASSYKSYPLLIVLDGHAHFKSISGMVNYMSSGYNGNRSIPEMIVVGIKNINRNRDFTPDKIVTKRKNVFGGGDIFLSFLEDELIPQLDQNYRTTPYRILFGHSLGGLLAAHTFMKEKTIFKSFIAVDPSLGSWDAYTMDKKVKAVSDKSFDRFIYIASANWGKRNIRNRDRHVRLYESLNNKCKGDFAAKLEYFEYENHGSVPVIAFYHGMISIFKGFGISYRTVENKDQLVNHFSSISQRLSWNFNPPEALVNRIGNRKKRGKTDEEKSRALEFFVLNTVNYPCSYKAFNSLAEMYESLGDQKMALKNYKLALELNTNNKHARKKIVSLK